MLSVESITVVSYLILPLPPLPSFLTRLSILPGQLIRHTSKKRTNKPNETGVRNYHATTITNV